MYIIPVKQCMPMILVTDLVWLRVSVMEALQATRATLVTRQQLLQKQKSFRFRSHAHGLDCGVDF